MKSGTPVQEEFSEWILDDAGLLDDNHSLQNTETFLNKCYCPLGDWEECHPSRKELQNIYDDNVQFLVDKGCNEGKEQERRRRTLIEESE
jgi:hypothetical protein